MLNRYIKNTATNEGLREVVTVKRLGLQAYEPVWQHLKLFTHNRTASSVDEIWVLEHLPVFTQGQAGKPEHVLTPGDIPVVQTDRGGQVTYHGPGQLIVYCLVDLQRKQLNLRAFIDILENTVVEFLNAYRISAERKHDAPGVYIEGRKVCSLGLRVRHGRTYHGFSLNVNMDLEPFTRINPCGYADMQVTQLQEFVPDIGMPEVISRLVPLLIKNIGYAVQ